MVALLREFPDVELTFNLVPSLLVQLEAFADDQARDRTLELSLKPAAQLDRRGQALHPRQLLPRAARADDRAVPALRRAAAARASRPAANGGAATALSEADFRDLQVWHKLAWVDPFWIGQRRARARRCWPQGPRLQRGRQAGAARGRARDPAAASCPSTRGRRGARPGRDSSASPFYHPILPLLCDTDVYLRTHPHSRMPRQRFRHPEDALAQLERAADYHEQHVRRRPRRAVALGRIGLRRDGPAGGAGRLHVDGDRRG